MGRPSWEKNEAERAIHHGGNALGGLIVALAGIALAMFLIAPQHLSALLVIYKWLGAFIAVGVATFGALFAGAAIRNWTKSPAQLRREHRDWA